MWPRCMCAECETLRANKESEIILIHAPEIDQLRELIRQTVVYLDARVGHKPTSRGYALLQRLNAALIRKD